jgi:hypothetical protein
MLLDVIDFKLEQDYQIDLVFENGEKRRFDMKPLLQLKPWNKLIEAHRYQQVSIDYGTLVWSGNIDISPETLYNRSYRINEA